MDTQPAGVDLRLPREAILSVPDAADVQILCRDGAVWITLDGQLRDFVLQRADAFSTPEHRRALIYAMEPSSITVLAAARTTTYERPVRPVWRLLEPLRIAAATPQPRPA